MENRTIDIVSSDAAFIQVCVSIFGSINEIELRTHSSLVDFRNYAIQNAIQFLLVDIRTFIKSPTASRQIVHHISESVPVAKATVQPRTGLLSGTLQDTALAGEEYVEFILKTVRGVTMPRRLREFDRKNLILNVRVFESASPGQPILVNTQDVSRGGIFVVSSHPFELGQPVELEILELVVLNAAHRLNGTVAWTLPWGKSKRHFCGAGIQFDLPLSEKAFSVLC